MNVPPVHTPLEQSLSRLVSWLPFSDFVPLTFLPPLAQSYNAGVQDSTMPFCSNPLACQQGGLAHPVVQSLLRQPTILAPMLNAAFSCFSVTCSCANDVAFGPNGAPPLTRARSL